MRPTTGCYGKLPVYGDFIRHNTAGPEIEQLDQWFQEGILLLRQTLGPRWEAAFDRAPAARLVFRPAGFTRLLIGVCVPGSDRTGRKFPFIIFRLCEAAPFERQAELLPAVFAPFLDRAQELASKGWVGSDVRTLAARVDELGAIEPVPMDEARAKYEAYLRTELASSLWTGLYGSFEHVGKFRLAQDAREVGRTLAAAPKLALGLKFPLPSSIGAASSGLEPVFWLDTGLRISGYRGIPPLAFWNQRGTAEDPGLFLFFQDKVSPLNFAPLVQPGMSLDHVYDLGKVSGAAGPDNATTPDARRILEDPQRSVGDVLTVLAGGRSKS